MLLSVGCSTTSVVSLVGCRSVHIGVPCLSIYDEAYLPVGSGVIMDQDASRQVSRRRSYSDDFLGTRVRESYSKQGSRLMGLMSVVFIIQKIIPLERGVMYGYMYVCMYACIRN